MHDGMGTYFEDNKGIIVAIIDFPLSCFEALCHVHCFALIKQSTLLCLIL